MTIRATVPRGDQILRGHEFLRLLHLELQPRTYFEIGVRKGRSLALSRVPSVGVDPLFEVISELQCDVSLRRTTSDEFFAQEQPFAHFEVPVVDLAYIDGMHLAEFALRDFINTERHCHPGSVIVVDDVLPRSADEASRGRIGTAANRGAWAGDVYKMVGALRTHRPDLVVLEINTAPTGKLVVLVPDPHDTSLATAYDDLVPTLVTPDPQEVPEGVLSRSRAIEPSAFLGSPIFDALRQARHVDADQAASDLRAACDQAGLGMLQEAR